MGVAKNIANLNPFIYLKLIVIILITFAIASSVLLMGTGFSGDKEEIKWTVSVFFVSLVFVFIVLEKLLFGKLHSDYLYFTEIIIMIVSVVECCIAILQYIGMIEKDNRFSIGTFGNNAGLISFLCLSFPLGIVRNKKMKLSMSLLLIFAKILTVIVILLCESRVGVLCLLAACILLSIKTLNFKKIVYILVFIIAAAISMAKFTKQESSKGRLFILQQSIEMICEKPITGWGINGFAHNYMSKQATFFMKHPKDKACQYADNLHHPLNEYIIIAVDYGIPCFCLLMIFIGLGLFTLLAKLKDDRIKQRFVIIIVCAILSFFSYPFLYPFSWIILGYSILCFIKTSIISNRIFPILRFPFALTILILHIFCAYKLIENIQLKNIKYDAENKKYGKVISAYQKIYEQQKENYVFLYAYSSILMEAGIYDRAERCAERCSRLYSDYNVCILNGDIKRCRRNYNAAIKAYFMAHYMCPSRITPLYSIMQTYRLNGEFSKSIMMAEQIINSPIKVSNSATDEMIKETKYFLHMVHHKNNEIK